MPRKLTLADMKQKIEPYGFFLQGDTSKIKVQGQQTKLKVFDTELNKVRTIQYGTIQRLIRTKKRAQFDYMNILPVDPNQPQRKHDNSGLDRWRQKYGSDYGAHVDIAFNYYRQLMASVARKRTFNINWKDNSLTAAEKLRVLVQVLKDTNRDPSRVIIIKVTDDNNDDFYYSLNMDTLQYFEDMLANKDKQEMTDSTNYVFDSVNDWKTMEISFVKTKHLRGGFFPYLNKTSLDLSVYGIFKEIIDSNYETNCLIQAIQKSNVYTDTEIEHIKAAMKLRMIRIEDLQDIADLLKTEFIIRIGSDESNDISFRRITCKDPTRKVTLILYMNHFMPNITLKCTEYYVQHYAELDKAYPDDPNRFLFCDDTHKVKQERMNIVRLIKLLLKYNAVEPIPMKIQSHIAQQYKHFSWSAAAEITGCCFRPLQIREKNRGQALFTFNNRTDNFKGLFGTEIPKEQQAKYLKRLQEIINSFNVKIDVRLYAKYTSLMEALMFELGCFEGVYETTGPVAKRIRDSLVFPAPHTTDGQPFYSKDKLYYIDINGAYLSVIDSIPTGTCGDDLVFSGKNTKIRDLVQKLYDMKSKEDPVIAKCLKLMINCSWGLSIRKNKVKISKDNEIQSMNVSWSYPQFAREVLTNFHNKIHDIERLVKKVYYYNVDALLIDEEDYFKLKSLGYIGSRLGQFKIEHVFTELYIQSPRKWIGRERDGSLVCHGLTSFPNTLL